MENNEEGTQNEVFAIEFPAPPGWIKKDSAYNMLRSSLALRDLRAFIEQHRFWTSDSTVDSSCNLLETVSFLLGIIPVFIALIYSECLEYKKSSSPSKVKKLGKNLKSKYKGTTKKWEDNQRRRRCEWDRERLELDGRLNEQLNKNKLNGSGAANYSDVLKALSQALKKMEDAYLDLADKMVMENLEFSFIGSCVLVMFMKGEDVYVMNMGDSRAILAQKKEPDIWSQDLERINEETLHDLESFDGHMSNALPSFTAFQLTMDHSTSVDNSIGPKMDFIELMVPRHSKSFSMLYQ